MKKDMDTNKKEYGKYRGKKEFDGEEEYQKLASMEEIADEICCTCNHWKKNKTEETKGTCKKLGMTAPAWHGYECKKWEEKTNKKEEQTIKKKIPKELRRLVLMEMAAKHTPEATELIVKQIMKENHIFTTRDDEKSEMWIYHEGVYIPQAKTFIKEYGREVLGKSYSTYVGNQVIAKIEAETYINSKDFFANNNKEEVAVNNGILNVITKELLPFDPKKVFFNKIPITYEPGVDCKAIKSHLRDVLKYKEDLPVIQELFGYLLYKDHNIEKAFMFLGDGRNGKGKTLEIMKRFLGIDNCANVSLEQIENDNFAMSELFNKMANLAGDISKTALKNTGRFKGLTGRDLMSAPRKFLPMIHFQNYAKMIFCANELPITYDTTPAFWNRWLIIEFPYTFIPKKEYDVLDNPNGHKIADPNIIDKILTDKEMSGLLNWSLEGLEKIQKIGDFSYSKNTADVQRLWQRKSSSFNAFMKDMLVTKWGEKIAKNELRKAYFDYCKHYNLKVMGDKTIKNSLILEMGANEDRFQRDKQQVPYWDGITFIESIGSKDSNGFSYYREKLNFHIGVKPPTSHTNLTKEEEQIIFTEDKIK